MSNNSEYKAFTDQWMQSFEYLERNQRSMNAAFEVCFNDGKFHISCSEIDPQYSKYKEELEKLANYIAKGAYVIAYNVICNPSDIRDEDLPGETEFRKKQFVDNFPDYLQYLLTNGRDPFLSIVYTHSAMLDSAYQMRHMHFDGKNWLNFKGEALINGTWTSANGSKYADAASDLMLRMTA